MSDFDEKLKVLLDIFEERKALRLPKSNKIFKGRDTDINLYLDDSYLYGLVSNFLHSKEPIVGNCIILNPSIDSELNDYHPSSERELEIIVSFQTYRKKMIELALALSQASGLPIEWR